MKNEFTITELAIVRVCTRLKQDAPKVFQRRCRDEMRSLGFYISHFGLTRFTEADLDKLLESNTIRVVK